MAELTDDVFILPTHGRYEHSSIVARPTYRWPNGARLAVYFALGIEHYAFDEGLTEKLVPGIPPPDVLNTSWREYGNRVAVWRMLDAFAEYGLPLSILLNTAVYDYAPDVTDACRKAGHEVIAHGRSNSESMAGMGEAEEAAYIQAVTDRIFCAEAKKPGGWSSPWMAEDLPEFIGGLRGSACLEIRKSPDINWSQHQQVPSARS